MTNLEQKVKAYPYKHGMTDTRIFRLFKKMKSRCSNPKEISYQHYGAKGISVEWPDFQSFYDDMGKAYEKHVEVHGEKRTTIERIDSTKNYSVSNCRWATPYEQSRNTSQNRFIKYRGVSKCLSDWADDLGIKRTTLAMRLDRYGWPVTKAFETEVKSYDT